MGEEFALRLTDGSLHSQPLYSPIHAPNEETVSWKERRNAAQWWKGTAFSITICQYLAVDSWIALDTSASMRWGQSHFRVHFLHQYSTEMHYNSKGIESTSNPTSHSHHTAIPHSSSILHFKSQAHHQSYNCTTHQATDTLIQHTTLKTRNYPLHSFQKHNKCKSKFSTEARTRWSASPPFLIITPINTPICPFPLPSFHPISHPQFLSSSRPLSFYQHALPSPLHPLPPTSLPGPIHHPFSFLLYWLSTIFPTLPSLHSSHFLFHTIISYVRSPLLYSISHVLFHEQFASFHLASPSKSTKCKANSCINRSFAFSSSVHKKQSHKQYGPRDGCRFRLLEGVSQFLFHIPLMGVS